ncbi:MAG TPA: NADH-quinone oxidoreductase subunit N [Acidobacteriaceae bacterium]|jgi:NADH-quinone oxidoreductase subunit N|nr:NADH-quinone oxidoreductase subunit N [Acidobacteriaceae bacterium]
MTAVSPALRILPEILLTLTGVLVMLVEPLLGAKTSRKPLGILALLGTVAAICASAYQLRLPAGTAFFGTVRTDAFSVFFHLLIGGILLVTLLVSLDYFEGHSTYVGEFYALVLFSAVGMMFMTCAVELLMVFIGLEISSISTYILAGYRKRSATSPEASIKYFLLGSFATAFFLYGVALCFGATGSTNIYSIAAGVASGASPILLTVALGMMLIGLGFKVSAAPFHVWTPDVYEGAPAPVVGFMSTGPKAAAFAVLLRITFGGFGAMSHIWIILLWIMAVTSMTIGNLGALTQRNVKRMLAYSSIAHAGYLLVAFTAFSADGLAAACFYTAAYAAMNLGAFAIISYLSGYDERRVNLPDYAGLARRHPMASAAMAIFLLSLIGIPFTAGFFGKFYVFTAAMHSGQWIIAIIGLLNSGLAAFYYLRLLSQLYTQPYHADLEAASAPAKPAFVLGIALLVAAVLVLGIVPNRTLRLAQNAAATYFPAVTSAVAGISAEHVLR